MQIQRYQLGMRDRRHSLVGMLRQPRRMTSLLSVTSTPVTHKKTLHPAPTSTNVERRLFMILDVRCASSPAAGILLRSNCSVSDVLICSNFGYMMFLLGSWMAAVLAGARSSKILTFDAESNSSVLWMSFGFLQPGFDVKIFTKLLVTKLYALPACVTYHFSFQFWFHFAPTFSLPCFSVSLCPSYLLVHVVLLWPMRTSKPCVNQ